MAKKHIVKCKYCGEQFDTNQEPYEMVSARRYAHKKCIDKLASEEIQKQKDEDQFYQYVKKIFNKDYNYLTVKRMAEKYIKENGYTYNGMLKSLIWFYEIKKNPIEKAHGSIGIIPYIYNEAKDYYYSLFLIKQINQEKEINNYKPKVKVIEIESPKVNLKPPRLFNMED